MTRIQFGKLHVDEIKNCSGIFTGINVPMKWRSVSKTNEGQGLVHGDRNEVKGNIHIVHDEDEVDMGR
jgi:hypothetical protein